MGGGGIVIDGKIRSELPEEDAREYNEGRRAYYSPGVDRVVSRCAGREYGPAIIEWAAEYYKDAITLDKCVENINMIKSDLINID
jgi:hypothetical protein